MSQKSAKLASINFRVREALRVCQMGEDASPFRLDGALVYLDLGCREGRRRSRSGAHNGGLATHQNT